MTIKMTNRKAILELLKQNPDGVFVSEIRKILKLKSAPEVYLHVNDPVYIEEYPGRKVKYFYAG